LTDVELAWAAGLFEGEGSFKLWNGRYTTMVLSMTDKDVVERFARIVEVGTIRRRTPQQEGWKEQWVWNISAHEHVRDLTTQFLPFLGERRAARAREVLEAIAANQARVTEPVDCAWCGDSFTPSKFHVGRARFCTRYCQQEWFKRKRRKPCAA